VLLIWCQRALHCCEVRPLRFLLMRDQLVPYWPCSWRSLASSSGLQESCSRNNQYVSVLAMECNAVDVGVFVLLDRLWWWTTAAVVGLAHTAFSARAMVEIPPPSSSKLRVAGCGSGSNPLQRNLTRLNHPAV
jgi:hypothetical protein